MKVYQDIKSVSNQINKADLAASKGADLKAKKESLQEDSNDGSYNVQVSEKSMLRDKLSKSILEQVRSLPEIRKEKVDSIKERISLGTYKVNSEAVLDKFLKEEALDGLAMSILTRKK